MAAVHVAGEIDDDRVGDLRDGHGLVADRHGLTMRDDERQRGCDARDEAELDRLVVVEHRVRRRGVQDGRAGDARFGQRLADPDVEREIEMDLRKRAGLEGGEGGGGREEREEEHVRNSGGLLQHSMAISALFQVAACKICAFHGLSSCWLKLDNFDRATCSINEKLSRLKSWYANIARVRFRKCSF